MLSFIKTLTMIKKLLPDITPLLAILIAIWVILLIPFQIIGHGFLPPDDALWHSAKVVSGKNWADVLVLRDSVKIESHPGWHAILGFVHRITKWNVHSLVMFSVISLFVIFCLIPLFFLRYPEAWLLSLLTLFLASPGWIFRLLLGRPYIFTMCALLMLLFLWPKLKSEKINPGALIALIFITALAAWVHRTWYMLLVPITAFLLAREWRASFFIIISSVAGIFIGAAITGHPVLFMKQTVLHLLLVMGSYENQSALVSELQPSIGDFNIEIVILALMGWRALRGRWNKNIIDNPVFILIILCFIGCFITRRVWVDFGMPAMAVWAAKEYEDFLAVKFGMSSPRRIVLALVLAIVLFMVVTTDAGGRWSACHPQDYLSSSDPEQAPWLPGPGGIIYSDDMSVFFQTVYRNPNGNWRYILGSEAAIMPEEDLKILRNIQRDRWTYKTFEPWVKKMRLNDRLIMRGDEDHKPKIPELEWKYAARGIWVGRKPNVEREEAAR